MPSSSLMNFAFSVSFSAQKGRQRALSCRMPEDAPQDKELYAKEQQLLLAAKSVDQALVEQDATVLDNVLDDKVVLHADHVTVLENIQGIEAVKKYFTDYWTFFEYQHSPVASAADGKSNIAFTFAVDEGIKLKSGKSEEPSYSVGIWAYEFTNKGKMSDIWFLRSLIKKEIEEKFKKQPGDIGLTAADYLKMREPKLAPDQGRTGAMLQAAEQYSGAWATGKLADVHSCLVEGFREVDPLLGNEIKGRDELEHAIKSLSLMWESTSHSHQVAVTPDSCKAFVLWRQQGFWKESKQSNDLFGLNLILFDQHHKIQQVVGYRKPLAADKKSLLK